MVNRLVVKRLDVIHSKVNLYLFPGLERRETQVRTTSTSECVTQEATPAAASGLASIPGGLYETLLLILSNDNGLSIDLSTEHNNFATFSFLGL